MVTSYRATMESVFWLFSAFSLLLATSHAEQEVSRKLSTVIFCPSDTVYNCSEPNKNGSYVNVAYSRADSSVDSLHYIYSSLGFPTIFLAKTPHDSHLDISWSQFLSDNATERANSLKFSKDPSAALALVFTKLIEFNDTKDTGKLPDPTQWRVYDFSEATWDNSENISAAKDNIVQFRLSHTSRNRTQSMTFKFQSFDSAGKSAELPHLHFNANITQIYITLDNFQTTFSQPRFAIEMVAVTMNASKEDAMAIVNVRSIDDESTPGAFHTINWVKPSSDSVYLQWKPLCYTAAEKSLGNARNVDNSIPVKANLTDEARLASAFFGSFDHVDIDAIRLSFGETGDRFYTATNYTTWAFSVGYGTPPEDGISLMIILVISIGLGIPIVLMILGGIYICVKNHRQRVVGYEDITSSYPPIGT